MLTYGSVCSGIEAASVAWEPLGWRPKFFAEIEAFPSAVLAHHYGSNLPGEPLSKNGVPNYGDFTTIPGYAGPVDLLVGGTPCQDFSVAGKRLGLDGARGNLALEYVRLAKRLGARWVVWENVPGVFSRAGGRDFAIFLGLLAGRTINVPKGGWRNAGIVAGSASSYGLAWCVRDAQYVRVDGYPGAVPQRRKRVFVVGYLGDWRRAAAVLFEPEGMSGHPSPRRKAGQGIAAPIAAGSPDGSGYRNDADTTENLIAFAAKDSTVNPSVDVSPTMQASDGRGHGAGLSIAYGGNNTAGPVEVAAAINAHGGPVGRLDFDSETFVVQPTAATLDASYGRLHGVSNQDANHGYSLLVAHTLRADGFDASEDGSGKGTPLVVSAPAVAASLTRGADSSGKGGYAGRRQEDDHNLVAMPYTLAVRGRGESHDLEYRQDGTANAVLTPSGGRAGIGVGAVAIPFDTTQLSNPNNGSNPQDGGPMHSLSAHAHPPAVAFSTEQEPKFSVDVSPTLKQPSPSGGGQPMSVSHGAAVRRLMPHECARLQGFADERCRIPWKGKPASQCPDGPQYKAYGNSMAVNVMRWIGIRIDLMEQLVRKGRI